MTRSTSMARPRPTTSRRGGVSSRPVPAAHPTPPPR
jgi:hypothetical protein